LREPETARLEMQIEHTIEIGAPPERVFAVLSDPTKLPRWQTSTVEVRRDAEGPLRVGERFQEIHAAFGRHLESTVQVAECEPPTTLALHVVDGPLPLDGRWILEPREGGTRLHFRGEARLRGLRRAATPFVKRALVRQFVHHHRHLRQILEDGGEPQT
jgi:uncharacterized protein YndB with AHSA1/START domain